VHAWSGLLDTVFREIVPRKGEGRALYEYLRSLFPFLDPGCWEPFVAAQNVRIDGRAVGAGQVLSAGTQLDFTIHGYHEPSVDTGWYTLWENEELLAVHKPATLPVSRTTRNIYNTLVRLVRRESPWSEAHLLHRLDRETGGILLLGKTQAAAARYQPNLRRWMTGKLYHAVVYGEPNWCRTEMECNLSVRPDSAIRCQMHVCPPGEPGKSSHSRFEVLQRGAGFSLVQCELLTGRKHQLRAHLAALGHPIVGDKIYAHNGHFFLQRLHDSITEADKQELRTDHHLLLAKQVTLIFGEEEPPVTLVTPHYTSTWRTFCAGVGIGVD